MVAEDAPLRPNQPEPKAAAPVDEGAGGTRLSRIRILSSARFRLTAWYTMVLVLIIVVLGILLSVFLSRTLEQDVDQRLDDFSGEVVAFVERNPGDGEGRNDRSEGRDGITPPPLLESVQAIRLTPDFTARVTSGLFIVVADTARQPYANRGEVPQEALDLVDMEAIRRGASVYQTLSFSGQRVRLYSVPVSLQSAVSPDQTPVTGAVVVGESLERQDHVLEILNTMLRFGGALGILVATWSGWVLAGRALAPVNRIANTANAIARKGDTRESLATRLPVGHNKDELARLAETFNGMLERIDRAFQAQRRFVADASHELRTPLTAIRGNVDVLARAVRNDRAIQPDHLRDALGDMHRESARMARLIDDLLLLARTDAEGLGHMVHPEPVSLDVIAREAFRTAEALADGQALHIYVNQPLMIYGDGDRLAQVIIILLENAIRHTAAGGNIDLIVDAAESDDGRTCARLKVVDAGEGIPLEHHEHLFERFYRVEGSRSRQGGGSGLGLAIAMAIVQGHNGWIKVDSRPGGGTRFEVWLPILESPDGAGDPITLTPGQPGGIVTPSHERDMGRTWPNRGS